VFFGHQLCPPEFGDDFDRLELQITDDGTIDPKDVPTVEASSIGIRRRPPRKAEGAFDVRRTHVDFKGVERRLPGAHHRQRQHDCR